MNFPTRSHTFCAAVLLCLAAYGPACAARASHDPSQPAIIPNDLSDDAASTSEPPETLVIPGPLRSFLRMAGISQEISTDEVLPMLARNAALYGYQAGKETEYLVLVSRYIHLGRELLSLADANGTIHVSGCDEATRLVQVLGYRFQHPCGQKDVSFSTANAERAFLTIDSGFPLTGLEEALSNNQPFSYSFPATRVPIFFRQNNWIGVSAYTRKSGEDLVDELLHDQNLDRLYAALARCDDETRLALLQSPGLKRLVSLAPVFDLYGSGITIQSGRVIVPADDDKVWQDLVDANPHSPGDFVIHLLTRDNGWLAAYYDVLTRLSRAQQAQIVEGNRLRRLYSAYRSNAGRNNAASGVFPKNADLLMLLTSVKWESNGDPQIPGGLGAWQEILTRKNKANYTREWIRRGRSSAAAVR